MVMAIAINELAEATWFGPLMAMAMTRGTP
jgi:hypothetical protein